MPQFEDYSSFDMSTNSGQSQEESPGIGTALLNALGMQTREQKAKEVQKFVGEVQASGSRDRALEVVRNYSSKFRAPQDLQIAFGVVDQHWPVSSKEMKDIEVFDEEEGTSSMRFVPSGQAPALNDPEVVRRLFGPRATLTKPDVRDFYAPGTKEGDIRYLGKLPAAKRPEGAMTLQEITEGHKVKAEARATARDQTSQQRHEEWLDLSERRFQATLGKLGETINDRDVAQGRGLLNDASRLTATSLNARLLPDGSFGFDDKDKGALFNSRLEYISRLVEQDPSILKRPNAALELHTKAVKAFPLKDPDAPAPEVKPKPAARRGVVDTVTDLFTPKQKPATEAKQADGAAPTKENSAKAINDKAKQVSARKDITAEQKAKALAKLRAIAKEQGVKVNF